MEIEMILATILFLISFTLVLASSYLITSIFAKKNSVAGLMYVPVVAFAQLVLSFEILSLFNAISVGGVLIFNVLNFWAAYYAWDKTGRALWGFDRAVLERFFNRLKNSFRLDKTLIVLGLCYAIFIVSAFILSFLMPATSGDAKTYHVARSFFYVIQGNLNHFVTGDI
ncbi:hypothetical protein IJV79_01000, partial [bacterium]|nr:hypothetical protein [bacterium]